MAEGQWLRLLGAALLGWMSTTPRRKEAGLGYGCYRSCSKWSVVVNKQHTSKAGDAGSCRAEGQGHPLWHRIANLNTQMRCNRHKLTSVTGRLRGRRETNTDCASAKRSTERGGGGADGPISRQTAGVCTPQHPPVVTRAYTDCH